MAPPDKSPRPAGPRTATLATDLTRAARLRAAFESDLAVFDSAPALIAASRGESVELVIVPTLGHDGNSLATVVATICASRRSPPVYIYADRTESEIRALVPLAHAGARGVILVGFDDSIPKLRQLLLRGSLQWASDNVRLAAEQVLSPRHLPLVLYCLERIKDPPTSRDVARTLRVSRRTLSAWARQAGVRGIRALTSVCRVLVAVEMLRGSSHSVEQVAHDLGFGSSAHLHNTIARYTGLRPREAATSGAAFWCLRLLVPGESRLARMSTARPAESRLPPAEWPSTPNEPIFAPRHQDPS